MTNEVLVYLAAGRGVAAILRLVGLQRLAQRLLQARAGTVRSSGFEFFPSRTALNGGRNLESALRSASHVRMILIGGSKLVEDQVNLGSVKKVLLPHPASQSLQLYAKTTGDSAALPAKIRSTTILLLKNGIAVRWYPHMISHAVIIADSDKPSGWAQWESAIPFASVAQRPCVVVSTQRFGDLVRSISESFDQMFDIAEPPRGADVAQ